MRRKIVAGNWKMNKSRDEALDFFRAVSEEWGKVYSSYSAYLWIAPPFLYLDRAIQYFDQSKSPVKILAQNCSHLPPGAVTGEVSAHMLQSIGVHGVIIGHSERRTLFAESDEMIAAKATLALEAGLDIILCIGETLEQREKGLQEKVVTGQLETVYSRIDKKRLPKVTIAYEPVWAIGTGNTATSEQAQNMHAFIRRWLENKFDKRIADSTSILYGGSCNEKNANELFSMPDIDGGLIGGASLDAGKFITIAKSFPPGR